MSETRKPVPGSCRRIRLRRALTSVGALAALLMAAALAAGDVYQWTDEEGRTHFSDHPPPDDATGIELEAVPEGADKDEVLGETDGGAGEGDTDMTELCTRAIDNAARFLEERAHYLVGADDPDTEFAQAVAEQGHVDPGEDLTPDEDDNGVEHALFAKALARRLQQAPEAAVADCELEVEAHEDIACMAEAEDRAAFEECDERVIHP